MILPALLLAAAAGILLLRPSASRRLGALAPTAPRPSKPASSALRTAPFVLAGVMVAFLIGGVLGPLLGLALLVAGPRIVDRLDEADQDDGALLTAQLPLALELLAACLSGGAPLRAAVEAVRDAVPGPCGLRFARVSAALAVGTPELDAFRALGDDRGPAGSAARALARAAEGGIPVAGAVARVAAEARRTAAAEADRRAKRAGVKAVGPLAACFLPAFVLLGVVPTVVGLATPVLRSF